jgi:hypothetical protein
MDPTFAQLLWPLVVGGDSLGRFDWATGALSLDVELDVWQNIDGASDADRWRAKRAYVHEHVHVLQVSLFGFVYRWSVEFLDLFRPALRRLNEHKDEVDPAAVVAAIETGVVSLTSDEREAVASHFAVIDEPMAFGITTRSILESHAHFVERRYHHPMSHVDDWAPHLDDAPAQDYRIAFDFLSALIGPEAAFNWFPLAAAVALNTAMPAMAFVKIGLDIVDLDAFPFDEPPRHDTALQVQRDVADLVAEGLLGSAQQVAAGMAQDSYHLRVVRAVNEATRAGDFDPTWAYVAPHEEFERGLAVADAPVFMRPRMPQGFAVMVPAGMDPHDAEARLVVAAMVRQLSAPIEAESRRRWAAESSPTSE